MKSVGLSTGIAFIVLGVGNVRLGLEHFSEFVLFGTNGFVLAGVFQIVSGIFFLLNEHKFRPEIPAGKSK